MIAALFVFLMFAIWTFLGPPVGDQKWSASNNGFGVKIAPREVIEADGQCYEGILAQEKAEFKLAWIFGLIAALPTFLFDAPYLAVFVAILAALGQSLARLIFDNFDYMGHNVEIMVAEEMGREGYRTQEIDRMIRRDRTDMTPAEVEENLRRWEWVAKIMRRLV